MLSGCHGHGLNQMENKTKLKLDVIEDVKLREIVNSPQNERTKYFEST